MPAVSLSPIFNGYQGFTINGLPNAGGLVNTYLAGTSTPAATYTDNSGSVANPTQIQLDASGHPPQEIWLAIGTGYRFVITDALGLNAYTYDNIVGVGDGVSQLTTSLASVSSAAAGAGQVGFNPTLNYVSATLGEAVQDGLVNVMWFLSPSQRAQVQANTTTTDLTTAINAAKTWGGNRPLYMPAGTWSITSLSFIGNLGGIVGDGIGVTIIRVRSAVGTAIDLNETTDANPRAGTFKGFTLDCNNFATIGFNIRYRHQISLEDLYITTAISNAVQAKDTYLGRFKNVRFHLGTIGLYLVGSNHASTFIGCTFDGCSTTQMKVDVLGTAADGNHSLSFVGCDFEQSSGTSNAVDINCTSLAFHGCYLGDGITSSVMIVRGGVVSMFGGTLFYGYVNAASYGVVTAGATARVTVTGAALNGQTAPNVAMLANQSTSGTVTFRDCNLNGVVTGTPILIGDPIGYGPQGTVYASRLGKNWTGEGNAITFSSVVTGNSQKFTCLTAPGPTPLLGARCALTNNNQWRDGENLYVLIVYESSQPCNISLAGSPLGGLPQKTLLSNIPATTGTRQTAIAAQIPADNAAYTVIEMIQQVSAVTDTLTIYEVILSDARMLAPGGTVLGNLYKC